LVIGIQTLAFSAVGLFHCASFHTLVVLDACRTAITAVVVATFVIVIVVTVAIAFEFCFSAARGRVTLVIGIQTLALVAEFRFHYAS